MHIAELLTTLKSRSTNIALAGKNKKRHIWFCQNKNILTTNFGTEVTKPMLDL